jgi:hypothetical protein
MKLSEQTNELFKALAVAQGEMDSASKGRQGHGYKYADLAECINTAKPVLAKNGLAVSQMLGSDQAGKQTMITILTHESGQYMSSEFVMVEAVLAGGSGKNPAQVLGSAITYQRRYAFAAIIGLAQEDDDAASVGGQQKSNKQQAITAFISNQQINELAELILSKSYTVESACGVWGIQSLSAIPASEFNNVINTVKGWS